MTLSPDNSHVQIDTDPTRDVRLFTPPPIEEIDSADAARESKQRPRLPGINRLTLTSNSKSIDQLSTHATLNAIHHDNSSTHRPWGAFSIEEEPTWIIPSVRSPGKVRQFGPQDSDAEGYVSIIRNLIKSSGIYVLASLISPLVALVLAPFLTHNLSGTDYGALAVLTTVIALIAGITQLGLGSAFFRSYNYDYETEKDRSNVLSAVVILLSLVSIPVAAVMIIAAPRLADLLLKSPSFSDSVKLAALAILIQNLTVPGFSWLRAEKRAIIFSALSVVNLLAVLVTTIVLVGVLRMGINGSLIATVVGYTIILICTLPPILLRVGMHLRLRMDITRRLLVFGLPNVANLLAVWVLQLSDRYLLAHLGSLRQVGSYNVAYTLGGVLSTLVITPFLLAWPIEMYSIAKRDDSAHVFQVVFRWFSSFLLFSAYGLSLVSIGLLNFFFPPSYHSAASIIPIIGISMVFYGIYNIFVTGCAIRRKTWFAVLFTGTSSVVNVLLNLILIPLYGSMGAAISTLLAYILLAAFAYIVDQQLYHIPYQIGLFIIALLIGVALFTASAILSQTQGRNAALAIYCCSLCLYGGCLVLFVWFPAHRRKN